MILSGTRALNRVALSLSLLAIVSHPGVVFHHAVAADRVDQVVVFKSKRLLMLLHQGQVIEAWPISLGRNPIGPKRTEGDKKTPEGEYFIDGRISNSRFHRSLHLSYPNEADVERARAAHVSPGNDIAIHGLPDDYRAVVPSLSRGDWTDGCIALDNRAIEVVWELVEVGTPVTILP